MGKFVQPAWMAEGTGLQIVCIGTVYGSPWLMHAKVGRWVFMRGFWPAGALLMLALSEIWRNSLCTAKTLSLELKEVKPWGD